jgi:hypothetical protein
MLTFCTSYIVGKNHKYTLLYTNCYTKQDRTLSERLYIEDTLKQGHALVSTRRHGWTIDSGRTGTGWWLLLPLVSPAGGGLIVRGRRTSPVTVS